MKPVMWKIAVLGRRLGLDLNWIFDPVGTARQVWGISSREDR